MKDIHIQDANLAFTWDALIKASNRQTAVDKNSRACHKIPWNSIHEYADLKLSRLTLPSQCRLHASF